MSLGNLKKLQAAEKLLKQGKTSEALEQLEQLARAAPSDVLTINRMGDLLARQGRTGDAIGYYFKIAKHYADGGYLPKAIAIYKKIVRLDPKSSVSLSSLGELYLRQKLPAEAQRFLTTAAQQYEEVGDTSGARDVYRKLVDAAPENPDHRLNLADAMAAAGDPESALAELLNLGDTLQRGNKGDEAERIYRRALELDSDSPEPVLGLARALEMQEKSADAIGCLQQFVTIRMEPQVLSELVLLLDRESHFADTESLLCHPGAEVISDTAIYELLELALSREGTDAYWERMDRVFAAWQENGKAKRVGEVLERLSQAEHHGHIPALERFERFLTESGDTSSAGGVLESLITACRNKGDDARASQAMERLQAASPSSSMLASNSPAPAVHAMPASPSAGDLPPELEAPAVPLSRSDKEFVTGRLTQAEILEKYSLQEQATQQVLEVTARFPGHVGAQQKLLALRRPGDPASVRDTLVSLALACRAAGDAVAACSAAAEAISLGGMDPKTEGALSTLGLLGTPPTEPQEFAMPEIAAPLAPTPPAPVAAVPVAAEADGQEGFLIDFDAEEDDIADDIAAAISGEAPLAGAESPVVPVEPTAQASASVRAPGPDMLSEIQEYLQQGRAEDAQKGVIALESLGYGSSELDALAAQSEALLRSPAESQPVTPDADALLLDLDAAVGLPVTPSLGLSDADDLSTITAALEVDAVESEAPLTPDAGTEQSVDEVFAAFRQAVEEEVGEDSRTHYDLAIGYKEMGLLDEAIDGFKVAAKANDLARDANMMLAVCYREQGDTPNAIQHYRLAASIECEDPEIRVATLYDLAEVLSQVGDEPAALQELRQVLELDPGYRDARQRVDDLENRLQV